MLSGVRHCSVLFEVQQVPVCLSVNKHTSVSSDDDRKKKKRKHCELLRSVHLLATLYQRSVE